MIADQFKEGQGSKAWIPPYNVISYAQSGQIKKEIKWVLITGMVKYEEQERKKKEKNRRKGLICHNWLYQQICGPLLSLWAILLTVIGLSAGSDGLVRGSYLGLGLLYFTSALLWNLQEPQ
jgi:hypothetical protein